MKKEVVVACTGVFDGEIHPGHINLLKSAKALGNKLVVFVSSDYIIEKYKNRKPIFTQAQRIQNLKDTGIPDEVILHAGPGEMDNMQQTIDFNPDIYCFGGDQMSQWNQDLKVKLEESGCKTVVIPRYQDHLYSTTLQYKKMQGEG
jgi:cytidyltransferase-like protein